MSPTSPAVAHTPAPSRRPAAPKPMDGIIWVLFVVVSFLALIWTHNLYSPKRRHFPRYATDYRNARELDQVVDTQQKILERKPDDLNAWVELCLAYFEQGPERYIQSLEALERARELGALDDRLFYLAAAMYEAKGLPEFARPEYERYLRHSPEDDETRLRLANLSYHTNDLEKAQEEYRRVLKHAPQDPLVLFNLATVYRDRQMWLEGQEILQPLVASGAKLPNGTYKLLGDLWRGTGAWDKALDAYQKDLPRFKDNPKFIQDLAELYEERQELQPAVDQWRRLLTLDPKNTKAARQVRILSQKIAQQEKANAKKAADR